MSGKRTVATGIYSHKDTHALCVVDRVGHALRTGTYDADAAGHDEIATAIGTPGIALSSESRKPGRTARGSRGGASSWDATSS